MTLTVVAANLVYLAGITDPNPINYFSGLATSIGPTHLPGLNYVDPNIGITSQALGHLAAMDWLHGHIPWWNYYEGLGTPLAGEMQSAALFPLVLLDTFSDGQVLFRLVLELAAAISTYLLLRRLVDSRWAAIAGGVAFGLNGTFAWMFHAPGNPIAFAPMLILGLEFARDRTRRLAGVALVAIALALSIYAGFPEVAYIDGLLAGLWFVLRASELKGDALLSYVRRVSSGVVLGLLLAAPILIAFGTYLQSGDSGAHGDGGFAHAYLARAVELPDVIMPYVFGPIIGWTRYDQTNTLLPFWSSVGGYLGISVVFLALVGLFGTPHRRLRIGLAVWAVLAIGRTVGNPVALHLVNAIPGISKTAFFRYAPPSVSLAVIVLAALGIDDITRRRNPRLLVVLGLLALAATWLASHRALQILHNIGAAPHKYLWADLSIAGALGVIVLCVVFAVFIRSARWRGGALSFVVVLETVALFVVPEFSIPTRATIDVAAVRFLQAHSGTERFVTFGPFGPNYGSYFGVASVNINDLPIPKTYATYIKTHLDPQTIPNVFTKTTATTFLAHLEDYEQSGVGYLVVPTGTDLTLPPGVQLPVVYEDPQITIRKLPDPDSLFSSSSPSCRVASSAQDGATVDCDSRGTLVYREQYLPGWSSTDNGHPVPDAPYQSVFQRVDLEPGRNVVDFRFLPPHLLWAEFAFAAGVLGLLAVIVVRLGSVGARQPEGSRVRRSVPDTTKDYQP